MVDNVLVGFTAEGCPVLHQSPFVLFSYIISTVLIYRIPFKSVSEFVSFDTLSNQAVAIIEEIKPLTHRSVYVFPSSIYFSPALNNQPKYTKMF